MRPERAAESLEPAREVLVASEESVPVELEAAPVALEQRRVEPSDPARLDACGRSRAEPGMLGGLEARLELPCIV